MIEVAEGQITMEGDVESVCRRIVNADGERCDHPTSRHPEDGRSTSAIGEELRPCRVGGCGCDDFQAQA